MFASLMIVSGPGASDVGLKMGLGIRSVFHLCLGEEVILYEV
jgi:hypothetical protein